MHIHEIDFNIFLCSHNIEQKVSEQVVEADLFFYSHSFNLPILTSSLGGGPMVFTDDDNKYKTVYDDP
jgi:hypothetical protein